MQSEYDEFVPDQRVRKRVRRDHRNDNVALGQESRVERRSAGSRPFESGRASSRTRKMVEAVKANLLRQAINSRDGQAA